MQKYKLLGKKGEGTFSAVLKAQCTSSDRVVAIKCMKSRFDRVEQVNRLREIQALRRLSPHPCVVKLFEVLYDRASGRLALVFELMDMDLYDLIKERRQYLPEDRVLHIMYQLTKAVEHMHRNGIFHRDIKPENVLISDDKVKLADFGSCRGINSKAPFTEYIATRWYRPPECLLTDGHYTSKMDIWGTGCVFFEIIALRPLFPGTNEIDQLHRIHHVLGTPPREVYTKLTANAKSVHGSSFGAVFPDTKGTPLGDLLPRASADAVSLIQLLLIYDPDARITAKKALRHAYFHEIRTLDRQLRAEAKAAADARRPSPTSTAATTPLVHLPNIDSAMRRDPNHQVHFLPTVPPAKAKPVRRLPTR